MIYRIVASILLLAALGALAFLDTGTQPAAATSSTPSGVSADDSAMKALKLN